MQQTIPADHQRLLEQNIITLLEQTVAVATFPIYGVVRHPYGVALRSIGVAGFDTDVWSVLLRYAFPPRMSGRADCWLEVISTRPDNPTTCTTSFIVRGNGWSQHDRLHLLRSLRDLRAYGESVQQQQRELAAWLRHAR